MDNTFVRMFAAINNLQPRVGIDFITIFTEDGERVEIEVTTMVGSSGREMVLNPSPRHYVGITHSKGNTYYWRACAFNTSKIKFI